MRILKYSHGFTRRHFLQTMGAGFAAGVLAPLGKVIAAEGDITKAYPDELLTIDAFTHGKLKAGDILDATNVKLVADALDPIAYLQISQQGRVCKLSDATTDIYKLNPREYIDATLRNDGQARFDSKGNTVTTDGRPWIGGNPFPHAKTAQEVLAGHTLGWGRYDVTHYPIHEYDLDGEGNLLYEYQWLWIEYMANGRLVLDPKPSWTGHEDKLRYNTVVFTYPNDVKGTSVLNIWPYDQTQFPDFFGYLPSFKRVRRYPSNQRFEPIIAGSTFFLTDGWALGDPYLTWGNFTLVGRKPMLGCVNNNWQGDHDNWEHGTCGGKTGKKFWRTTMELVPECFIVDLEPTSYKRAPYGKKRVWFDARTLIPVTMNAYDRRGDPWKQFEAHMSIYEKDGAKFALGGQNPYWSWTGVHAHDIQSDRITRFEHTRTIAGGYEERVNDPAIFEQFCTEAALRRLGT